MSVANEGCSQSKELEEFKKMTNDELMSSEDAEYFEDLNKLALEIIAAHENDVKEVPDAIEKIMCQLKKEKSLMTSLPRPFTFLSIHYETFVKIYDEMITEHPWKKNLADLLSILSMIYNEESRCLKYNLSGTGNIEVAEWGMEYSKHLIEDIRVEYYLLAEAESTQGPRTKIELDDPIELRYAEVNILAREVFKFCVSNNADIEACDLAMETEQVELIKELLNEQNYRRVLLYIKSCCQYISGLELSDLLIVTCDCYMMFHEYAEALYIAIRLNRTDLINKVLVENNNSNIYVNELQREVSLKQLACILYENRVDLDELELSGMSITSEEDSEIFEILNEIRSLVPVDFLNEHYKMVARELDILSPRSPDEVFKEKSSQYHMMSSSTVDPSKNVVASSLVSGFVNAGYKTDCVLKNPEYDWLNKLRDASCLTAVACNGLMYLWDIEEGLLALDKYVSSSDSYIKAGALMGCGILSTGNPDASNTTFAILSSGLEDDVTRQEKLASIISMGIALAGTNNSRALDSLHQVFEANSIDIRDLDIVSAYALSAGMIGLGSSRIREITNLQSYIFFMKDKLAVKDMAVSYLVLGFALLFFGTHDVVNIIETLEPLPASLRLYCSVLLKSCAHAGTGCTYEIEKMMKLTVPEDVDLLIGAKAATTEKSKTASKSSEKQKSSSSKSKKSKRTRTVSEYEISDTLVICTTAILGVSIMSVSEDIGTSMIFRVFTNMTEFGHKMTRRAVPLAVSIVYASNPQMMIVDYMSKLSHDLDLSVTANAILGIGIIGAGTNNAKISSLLRSLGSMYHKDPVLNFNYKCALGLLHTGKGLLSLSPFRANRSLVSMLALASLFIIAIACIDTRTISNEHYLFFWLSCALKPRFLITIDEDNNQVHIPVRVGQAVDTAAQAGDPRTVTGFQTHKTPVLFSFNEKAELATDEYIPYSSILEGIVYVRKNPDFQE